MLRLGSTADPGLDPQKDNYQLELFWCCLDAHAAHVQPAACRRGRHEARARPRDGPPRDLRRRPDLHAEAQEGRPLRAALRGPRGHRRGHRPRAPARRRPGGRRPERGGVLRDQGLGRRREEARVADRGRRDAGPVHDRLPPQRAVGALRVRAREPARVAAARGGRRRAREGLQPLRRLDRPVHGRGQRPARLQRAAGAAEAAERLPAGPLHQARAQPELRGRRPATRARRTRTRSRSRSAGPRRTSRRR